MFYSNREIYWNNFALVHSRVFCLVINGSQWTALTSNKWKKRVHNALDIIKKPIIISLKLFRPEIKQKNVGAERHNFLLFYRVWRCASSVWTRRPSPRRPWPRVRWGVWRIQRGRSPRPPGPGSGPVAALGPLPRRPADHPSVFAGSTSAQVKKRSCSDAPLAHAPSRQRTVIPHTSPPETRDWKPGMVSPSSGDPTDTRTEKSFKGEVGITSASAHSHCAVRESHDGTLRSESWPTFQVASESHLSGKVHHKDVRMLVTPSSGRIELNHWPPNLKFYL